MRCDVIYILRKVICNIIPDSFYLAQASLNQKIEATAEEDDQGEILGTTTAITQTEEAAENVLYEAPKEKSFLAKIWTFLASMLP